MKKELIFFLFILGLCVVIFPLISQAQDYGISGRAELTYEEMHREDEESSTEQKIFGQQYNLDYKNFIYHPRLLSFSLSGTFVTDDTESNGVTQEFDAQNYNLNLNFLNETRYPFNISAFRNTSTSLIPLAIGSSVQEQTFQAYRLRGRIAQRGRLPSLEYGASQDEKQVEGTRAPTDERERELYLRFQRKWTNSSLRLNYDFRNSADMIASTERTSHALSLSGNTRRRLSRTATLNAGASYSMNSPSDVMRINVGAKIDYNPSARFNGSSDLRYEHLMEPDRAGDSISNALQANYRISRKLRANAGSSVNFNSGSFGESSSESVNGSLYYTDRLARNTNLSASGSAGFSSSQGGEANNASMNGSLSTSLNRSFPAIRSSVSSSAFASFSSVSAGDNSRSYKVDVVAESTFIRRLTARSRVEYSVEQTTGGETENLLVSDSTLKYFMFFGWRARLNLRAGAAIQQGSTEKQFFHVDEDFRFIFHRNLRLESSSRYENDFLASTQSLSANAALRYHIRRISLSAKYAWRRDESESGSSTTTHVYLSLSRGF
ncbi:hypothetical protein BMS3Abin10_01689 [bacterium BMS3Abin10]|nr:hypothetical protein BMS3Abin10_01689 [bacterium BMS3Abin10]GBE39164.1 hypothetical protein BMS3Bbin08_01784 [bacterium BMS3Bbin08]